MEIRSAYGLDNIPDARYIREEVFVKEQGFREEFEGRDDTAWHTVIYIGGKPAATGRTYRSDDGRYIVGRIAVMKEFRGNHLGSEVMRIAEDHLRELGAENAELSAQLRVKQFYESVGYTAVGDTYFEEHVEHIRMIKKLGGQEKTVRYAEPPEYLPKFIRDNFFRKK